MKLCAVNYLITSTAETVHLTNKQTMKLNRKLKAQTVCAYWNETHVKYFSSFRENKVGKNEKNREKETKLNTELSDYL